MNAAALNVYESIRREGSARGVLNTMQSRADLYQLLKYEAFEARMDEKLGKSIKK